MELGIFNYIRASWFPSIREKKSLHDRTKGFVFVWLILQIFILSCIEEELPFPKSSIPITGIEIEDHISYNLFNEDYPSNTGDLWPCVWGEGDLLYTANGDGMGFGPLFGDIVFNIIEGSPPNLVGYSPSKAYGQHIATLYGSQALQLSRKPTGITCYDGIIYLFFQNLKNFLSDNEFGDAPHASISVSYNGGKTWDYNITTPMFTNHIFTTGFFLDYGESQKHNPYPYIYVYGLDYNWRFSKDFLQTKLYLARVPPADVMDITQWEFFNGTAKEPQWTNNIDEKQPVLQDETLYCNNQSAIAQGSVVYIPSLNRYFYSSWGDCGWFFYEAPLPWGPWNLVGWRDWTTQSWSEDFHGGYPTVVPSKFMDEDGKGGWIISSLPIQSFDGQFYSFGMRRFELTVQDMDE